MKRIIALLLTVVMLFGTIMIDVGAYAVDIIYVKNNEGKETEEIDYKETVKQYLKKEFKTPEEKLATMELMYEKNGYQLFVDTLTGEVATYNMASGQTLFSNPYDVGATSYVDSTKEKIMSQIVIDYRDNDTDKTMYSFVEAAERGQITAKNIKNGIRIEYRIGREETRMLVPRMIEETRFETLILDPFADYINEISAGNDKMKVIDWRDYKTLAMFSKIVSDSGNDEWFKFNKLRAFYTHKALDECKTQRERSSMIAAYPVCSSMNIYVFASDATNTELTLVESYIKTYVPKYTYEELDKDHNQTGYSGSDKAPPLFKLSLEYTLDEWGMSVRMPANGLRFNESLYQLNNISILPYMGAGANYYLNDKKQTFTGYNFFPDGSGTLFRHEDLAGSATTTINGKVYGQDFAYNTITGSHQETIRYPVFGIVSNYSEPRQTITTENVLDEDGNIVYNEDGTPQTKEVTNTEIYKEDRGFVAIIEEGDALAELSTYHAGTLSKYNIIQMLFYPRPKDSYNLANAISVGANATWTVVSSRKYVGNYKIRYIMLTDDNIAKEKNIKDYYEVSWMGMAEAYRDYLYATGNLKSLKKEDVNENLPVYIQTFGTMETVQKILSVPVNVMTSMTSFDNIKTMYNELSAEGVSNIKFKLSGYANGGIYASVPYRLKWEKSVGGKSGYEDLMDYSKETNYDLEVFPDFDFEYVRASSDGLFDGLTMKEHIVKSINNTYMSRRYYSATKQTYVGRYELAISAAYFSHFYDKLTENLMKYYPEGYTSAISVGTIGTSLNSDFDEDDPANREDSKKSTIELMEKMANDYDDIMTEGANSYVWKYVDYIVDVPLDSSRYIKSSAAVPFIGVVLHGSTQYAGSPLNMEGNIGYSLLKAVENGASLYFILCYENYEELKEDMNLSQYYSVRYDILKNDVVRYYKLLNDLTKDLQLSKIIGHQFLIGERVPDPDEVIADAKEAEEAIKKAEEAIRIEEEKLAKEARNSGRIESLDNAKNAITNVKHYYESIKNCYAGGYTIDESGMVSNTIGMQTLVKMLEDSRKKAEETTAAAEKAEADSASKTELADIWKVTQNNFKSILSEGNNKNYSTLLAAYTKAQSNVDSQKTKIEAQVELLDNATVAAVDAGIAKIPALYKAYNDASDAYAKDASEANKKALDSAKSALTFISGTVDNAKAYVDATENYKAAEKAFNDYVGGLKKALSDAESALKKAKADHQNELDADAAYNTAVKALDEAKTAMNEITEKNNPEYAYWNKVLTTATSSMESLAKNYEQYETFSEYKALADLVAKAKAKLAGLDEFTPEYKAALANTEAKQAAVDSDEASFLGSKADYAAAKAAYDKALKAFEADSKEENIGRTAEYKALESAKNSAKTKLDGINAKLNAVSPVPGIVSKYKAAADKRNKASEALSRIEVAYFNSADYKKLVSDVEVARAELDAASKGYESDSAYKTLKENADKVDKAYRDYINALKAAVNSSDETSAIATAEMQVKFTYDSYQTKASAAFAALYNSLSGVNKLKTFDDVVARAKKLPAASAASEYLTMITEIDGLLANAKESNKEGEENSEKFNTALEKSKELLAAAKTAAEALADAEKGSYILDEKRAADAAVEKYVSDYIAKHSSDAAYKAAADKKTAADKALNDFINNYKKDYKNSAEYTAAAEAENAAKAAVTDSYADSKNISAEFQNAITSYDNAYGKLPAYEVALIAAEKPLAISEYAAGYNADNADYEVIVSVYESVKAEAEIAAAEAKTTGSAKTAADKVVSDNEKTVKTLDKTISQNVRAMNTFVSLAKVSYTNSELAYTELIKDEKYNAEFKDDVTKSYNEVKDLVKGIEGAEPADDSTNEVAKKGILYMAGKTYDYAVEAVELSKKYVEGINVVMTDPNSEEVIPVDPEEEKEEEEEGYKKTKYTDDSGNIVLVQYEGGISIILNYNYFDATTEYNGNTYTLSGYGAVRIDEVNGAEPIYVSFSDIND
ncbi:MAG: DUF5696 domain-containing protein [Clostridia bacterium]|nr:DUF5696 domain-containing protein [Clostridia bacterium]